MIWFMPARPKLANGLKPRLRKTSRKGIVARHKIICFRTNFSRVLWLHWPPTWIKYSLSVVHHFLLARQRNCLPGGIWRSGMRSATRTCMWENIRRSSCHNATKSQSKQRKRIIFSSNSTSIPQ
jgi:hypothetical protein